MSREGRPATGSQNAALADAVFRAGAVESFGTGIPRIKRECDEAGVNFRYGQARGFTTLAFDRPGAQVSCVDENGDPVAAPAGAWGSKSAFAPQDGGAGDFSLSEEERAAVNLAREQGKATWRGLDEAAGIGRDAARSVLRGLAGKAVLDWVGKIQNGPRQHYRLASRG